MTISNVSASAGSVSSASATSPSRLASSLWAGKKYESGQARGPVAARPRRRRPHGSRQGPARSDRAGPRRRAAAGPGAGRARRPPRHELEPAVSAGSSLVAVPDQVDGARRRGTGRSPGRALRGSGRGGPIIDDQDVGPAAVDDRGIPEGRRVAPPRHDDGVRLERRRGPRRSRPGRPRSSVRRSTRCRPRRRAPGGVGARSTSAEPRPARSARSGRHGRPPGHAAVGVAVPRADRPVTMSTTVAARIASQVHAIRAGPM